MTCEHGNERTRTDVALLSECMQCWWEGSQRHKAARQAQQAADEAQILSAVQSGEAVFVDRFTWADCDRDWVGTTRYKMPDGRFADVNDHPQHNRAEYVV